MTTWEMQCNVNTKMAVHVHMQVEGTLLESGEWKVNDLRIPTEIYLYTFLSQKLKKYQICCSQMCSFKQKMHQNRFWLPPGRH